MNFFQLNYNSVAYVAPARHISTTLSTLGSPASRVQHNLAQMDKHWEEVCEMQREYAAQEEQREHARRPPPRKDVGPRSSNRLPQHPNRAFTATPARGGDATPLLVQGQIQVFKSKHWLSLGMRYWGCVNYSSDYPDRHWDTRCYRQPVRIGSIMFPYHFSFKVHTNNLPRPPVVPGSAMWLSQVDRPRDPPT